MKGEILYEFRYIVALILLLYLAAVLIYRLRFHPLARYPGPWLARISDWYAAYHAYQGDLHVNIRRLHQRYGTIVRYGPNRLLFASVESLQTIYHSSDVTKSQSYRAFLSGPWNVHNTPDKVLNQRKRRAIRHGLSEDCLQRFQPALLRHIDSFIENISPSNDKLEMNIAHNCRYLIFDAMSEYLFGCSFDLQKKKTYRFMVDSLGHVHIFNSIYFQSIGLARLHLEKLCLPISLWYGWKLYRVAQEVAQKRQREGNSDLLSFILRQGTDESVTPQEALSEVKFLIVTGSGSPASTLAATLHYLSEYPTCYSRLVREIRQTFHSPSQIKRGVALSSCAYLQACITETLRMSPAFGGALWREVENRGILLDGEYISPGVVVGCGIYALHHNEKYFPDPYAFKPERWLSGTAHEAYAAFSLGPRNCLGRQLAMMELQLTIAKMLWIYDFRRSSRLLGARLMAEHTEPKGEEHEFQLEDHVVGFFDGPYIEIRRREIDAAPS